MTNLELIDGLYPQLKKPKWKLDPLFWLLFVATILIVIGIAIGKARAEVAPPVILKASWYSVESLKREGTWKNGKERMMANGKLFDENAYTCAVRGYKLGEILKVTNLKTGASVQVMVTDRIGKRFAKTRIDLSPKAFIALAPLSQGLISVKVEVIK